MLTTAPTFDRFRVLNSYQAEAHVMRQFWLSALFVTIGAASSSAADFAAPVRLKAGDKAIRVESPGYAAPCWADLNGDGKMHLVVGQFNEGKMQVFRHLGGEKFAAGEWLQADGKIAEVPGVW
jgi:hypothetical protein